MSFQVASVLNQQSLLTAALDYTDWEVQLGRKVQDRSGTNGPNWHNYPFLSSGAGELVEIILQEKKLAQHRAFSAIPMAEEKTFPITLQGHQFTSSTPKINTKSY